MTTKSINSTEKEFRKCYAKKNKARSAGDNNLSIAKVLLNKYF